MKSWRRFSETAPRECSRGVADGGIGFRSIERDGKRDNFGVGDYSAWGSHGCPASVI